MYKVRLKNIIIIILPIEVIDLDLNFKIGFGITKIASRNKIEIIKGAVMTKSIFPDTNPSDKITMEERRIRNEMTNHAPIQPNFFVKD